MDPSTVASNARYADLYGEGNVAVLGTYDARGVYNGYWYSLQSTSSIWLAQQWGLSTDKPLIGDFDGDARTDITVYRPAEGMWYMLRSSDGAFSGRQFGVSEDVPAPSIRYDP